MMLKSKSDVRATAVSVLLFACTVHGLTEDRRRGGAVVSSGVVQATGAGRQRRGVVEGQQRDGAGCEEGWLSTHHYCLLYTGLGEGEEAELFCAKRGALQVRGICITKPSQSDETPFEPQRQDLDTLTPSASSVSSSSSSSSTSSSGHQCPSGWAQVQDYCYFNPGPAAKVCELLGAQYVLNLCVARVPHEIPVDFMHAVKRLHGDDNHLERDTRLCCCLGGGLCK